MFFRIGLVACFSAVALFIRKEMKKRREKKAYCFPPIVPPAVIGFVARKLIDHLEKSSNMETRVAHLKYKLRFMEDETECIREALDYIYERNERMLFVQPEKPNEIMQCIEWCAENLKCF